MTTRAWIVALVTVVVGAVLQAATAVPGVGLVSTAQLVLETSVSVIALVLELALLAWAARSIASREPLGRLSGRLVLWALLVVVATGVVAVVLAAALVLVLLAALCVLPAAAAGEGNPLAGFRVFRRTPLRSIGAALVVALVGALSWVAALVSGLFLAGALGGLAMWLWFGLVLLLLLVWWSRRIARAAAPPETIPDDAVAAV